MTTKYKLPNKISVILLENKKAPVVSTHLWVKTGSADEKRGEEGISHFIEHLVFKGTRDFKVGEIAQTIEGSGGELNAYTTFDQTVYHITISKHYYEKALKAISQMAGFPTFDEAEINNEREVVIEEIKRSEDSPNSQASRLLFETAYPKHPYGLPVIGYESVIKKVPKKILVNYHAKRYAPENMTLVVAGDFSAPEMKKYIQRYFGEIKKSKLEYRGRKKETVQKKPKVAVKKSTFEETYVYFAWKIPDIKHKDIVAVDMLSMILGEGDSSRLCKKLRLEAPTVNYIGTSSFTLKDPGLLLVAATLNPKNIKEFLSRISQCLEDILASLPAEEELKKCRTQLEADEFYDLETVDGVNRKAGFLDYFLGDFRFYEKYLKQVYSVAPKDISDIARKYLNPKSLNIIAMVKEGDKEIKKELDRWCSDYTKSYKALAKQKLKSPAKEKKLKKSITGLVLKAGSAPEIKEYKLDNGMRAIFRIANDTPIVSAKFAALGGLRSEASELSGLTDLMSRCWTSGTKALSEDEINIKTELMAAKMGAFSGRNSAGASITLLSLFEDEGVKLFSEILESPSFPAEILQREKEIVKEAIKSQMDQPGYVVSQMFLQEIFSGHPYARDPQGTLETVECISRENIVAHYQKLREASGSLLVVSGRCNPTQWLDTLNPKIGMWRPKKAESNFEIAPLNTEIKNYKKIEKEQSHIIVGFRGLVLNSPQRYAMQLMQSILGGMGGRLFVELRERASLAYSVYPINFEGIDTGYVGAYIGCSPDKGKKAVEMMLQEFDKISSSKPMDDELDRAKKYLIGRHDIALQRNSAFANSILFNEIYGIPMSEIDEYADNISRVTAVEIRELANQLFSQKRVYCALGAICPW